MRARNLLYTALAFVVMIDTSAWAETLAACTPQPTIHELCETASPDTVCIDATQQHLRKLSDTWVLHPNHRIRIAVQATNRDATKKITKISLTGSTGETTPATSGITAVGPPVIKTESVLPTRDHGATTRTCTITPLCEREEMVCADFTPRVPGAAILTVTIADGDHHESPGPFVFNLGNLGNVQITTSNGAAKSDGDGKTKDFSFEYLVPKIYSGAIRVGLAEILGAEDHEYFAQKPAGTSTAEVVANTWTRETTELVLGYAPFLEAFSKDGGREYVESHFGVAPYIGLGVASANTGASTGTKIEWLRTFYFGGEVELFQGCSVAMTVALRRADRLAPDLHVGDPVSDGATLTETRLEWGGALIINFSPDFFKLAASLGAK